MQFKKATKSESRLRCALCGPAGSGKTLTALRWAMAMGQRVAVINTESGAVEKYLGFEIPGERAIEFDVCTLPDFSPSNYTQAIQMAGRAGYEVLIIDSLSHAWAGVGGALEMVDKSKSANSFTAWKDVTPQHNQMIEAILRSPCHIIATMRTKTEYVLEDVTNHRTGQIQKVPRKIGMAPVQRAGVEYEFDLVGDMDDNHTLRVTKSRCPSVDNAIVTKPGAAFVGPVVDWLKDGVTVPPEHWATAPEQLQTVQQAVAEQSAQQQAERDAQARRDELIAQAKAKAAAAAAPAAPEAPPFDPTPGTAPVTAPATTPVTAVPAADTATPVTPPNGVALATEEQLKEMLKLGKSLGMSPEMIVKHCLSALQKRPEQLTVEQAKRLLQLLRDKIAEHEALAKTKAAQAAAAQPAMTGEPAKN